MPEATAFAMSAGEAPLPALSGVWSVNFSFAIFVLNFWLWRIVARVFNSKKKSARKAQKTTIVCERREAPLPLHSLAPQGQEQGFTRNCLRRRSERVCPASTCALKSANAAEPPLRANSRVFPAKNTHAPGLFFTAEKSFFSAGSTPRCANNRCARRSTAAAELLDASARIVAPLPAAIVVPARSFSLASSFLARRLTAAASP